MGTTRVNDMEAVAGTCRSTPERSGTSALTSPCPGTVIAYQMLRVHRGGSPPANSGTRTQMDTVEHNDLVMRNDIVFRVLIYYLKEIQRLKPAASLPTMRTTNAQPIVPSHDQAHAAHELGLLHDTYGLSYSCVMLNHELFELTTNCNKR